MLEKPKQSLTTLLGRIGALSAILIVVGTTLGCNNYKPKLESETDKASPPPGYPDTFPYNNKRWQEGKMPTMPGMPLPPSQGGTPPPAQPAAK